MKLDLSLRTIQLRRASLLRKLQAHSRAELIRMAQSLEQLPAGA
jgi:DNA-binding NarL/FixJ family response regulator